MHMGALEAKVLDSCMYRVAPPARILTPIRWQPKPRARLGRAAGGTRAGATLPLPLHNLVVFPGLR